jgi:hypothetical protein
MTTTSEKLAKIDRLLAVAPPVYDPRVDPMRTDIVIVAGRQVFHYPQSLEKRHAYEKILVYPRRREPNVWVYYLATTPVGNGAEEYVSYLLGWPYRWVRGGSKWALLFPAAGNCQLFRLRGYHQTCPSP